MNTTISAPGSGGGEQLLSPSPWVTELRAQFRLGWPLVIAQLAQISLLTTDVVMLGWLGPKFLAASALANALFVAAQLFGIGVAEAVAPLVAQALGARDFKAVGPIMRQGILISVLTGIGLFPIIWNLGPIYHLLGQDAELTAMAERFVHFAIWLIFPSFLIVALRSFLAAHGNTRVILWIVVAGVGVNAAADYALIFGNWGLPRLELAGAGIATTIVNVVMLSLIILYIETHKRLRRYHIFHRLLHIDWPRFRQLLRIGVPIGFMRLAEVLLFTSAALLQGWLGQDEVAAHAIALQLSSITFMVPLGLSQATTVRIGHAFGEGNREGVRVAGWTSLTLTLVFMSAAAFAFLTAPHYLVGLFLDPGNPANARAISLAVSYLVVAGFFQLFDGTQVAMAAALRGLSDTRWPLVVALVGYWAVGMPVSWLLGFPLGLQGVGIWCGLAAGLAAVGLVLTARFALRERLGLTARPIAV